MFPPKLIAEDPMKGKGFLPLRILESIQETDIVWTCIDNELNENHIGWYRGNSEGLKILSYSPINSEFQNKVYEITLRTIGGKKFFNFEGDVQEFVGNGKYNLSNGHLTITIEVKNFIWPNDDVSYQFVIFPDPGDLYIPSK